MQKHVIANILEKSIECRPTPHPSLWCRKSLRWKPTGAAGTYIYVSVNYEEMRGLVQASYNWAIDIGGHFGCPHQYILWKRPHAHHPESNRVCWVQCK